MTQHDVTLAIEVGLDQASNGELIKRAAAYSFDVLVTPDKRLKYQQNLMVREIALVILPSGRWRIVQRQLREIVSAIDAAKPRSFHEIPLRGRSA